MFDMGASAVVACDVGSVRLHHLVQELTLKLFSSWTIILPETSEILSLAGG